MLRAAVFVSLALCALAPPSLAAPDEPAAGTLGSAQAESYTLVVHAAKDCPVCQRWREAPDGLALARRFPAEWPQLKLVFIDRSSLNGSEVEELYPQELAYLFRQRQERYQLSPPVPLFEIVHDGKVISRHAGLNGWAAGTVPELQSLQGAARQ